MNLFETEHGIFTAADFMFPVREPIFAKEAAFVGILTKRDTTSQSLKRWSDSIDYHRMSRSRIDISTLLAEMDDEASSRETAAKEPC